MNLIELADQHNERFGETVSLYFNDEPYTNVRIRSNAISLANGLIGLGIKPGDKVLVMLMNSPEVMISYGGILRAGAIIIPVIFLLGPSEVAHILKNSEASAVIVSKAFLETINQAKQGVDTLKNVIVVEDEEIPDTIKFTDLIKNNPDTPPNIKVNDDDMAVILYTSGTTGVPKGVMLTHKNLYTNAVSCSELNDPEPHEVGLLMLPLSHSFGLTVMNVGLMFPNTAVLMSWFDLEGACKLIEKYKVTGFAGVPAMFAMFVNTPEITDKYDLSSLERTSSGSAPLPVEVLKAFEEKFDCVVLEGYGLSEAAPVVTAHYVDRERKPGSIGQVIPGVEIKVVDENNNEVPTGEIGELTVKGPNVSPGYYKLKDETESTFKNGWLHTGDMAKMDEDGYVYIVDRKKDLIIRGGFNIVPRDVEEVLYTFPPVLEAAVVGVPSSTMGEEVKAFVVLREEHKGKITEQEIIDHCQKTLAKYKTPRFVEFIDVLPRNAIGKVQRKELRESSS